MLRRARVLRGKSNRYVDGTGRKLEGGTLPTDLYLEPLNDPARANAYPARAGHYQPVVRGEPCPFKGNVVVAGGGVVGSVVASLLALRGWHITVVEQKPRDDPGLGLETALVTKRAAEALEVAGVRREVLKRYSTRVTGILEHPGTINTWFTAGLSEIQPFAVNMLAVDIKALRGYLEAHVDNLPFRNAKVFSEHKLLTAIPDAKTAVVKPLRLDMVDPSTPLNEKEKGVVIAGRKFEDNVEGIDFDVLIGADGVNSTVRSCIFENPEAEVVTTNAHYATMWFAITGSDLDGNVIHRWAHRFPDAPEDNGQDIGFVAAFPRGNDTGCFNVMAYMPRTELEAAVPHFIRRWCPDLSGSVMEGAVTKPRPHPTVFVPHLYNSRGMFPNTVLLGDAAHTRNPFLLQDFSMALDDACYCVNTIDSNQFNVWDAVRSYSRERGVAGDSLRAITERSVFYARRKHINPLIRARNAYTQFMHYAVPRSGNAFYEGANNYMYPRTVEQMLHGRGYASYTDINMAQYRTNMWWCLTRLYT